LLDVLSQAFELVHQGRYLARVSRW